MTAPNTPKTSWIRDNGTTIEVTTDIFIDELDNFFVDENGDNLLDSVSTDGNAPAHDWDSETSPDTSWSDSFEVLTTVSTRITILNDTRVTIDGDTRVSNSSGSNKSLPHSWQSTADSALKWSDSYEVKTTVSYRTTDNGDQRVDIQGDVRISNHSDKNKKATTSWSEDEY